MPGHFVQKLCIINSAKCKPSLNITQFHMRIYFLDTLEISGRTIRKINIIKTLEKSTKTNTHSVFEWLFHVGLPTYKKKKQQ